MIGETHATLLLIRHKIDHHIGLVVADGDGDIALMDNSQRYRSIRCARAYLFHIGDTQNDEHPAVVIFITGTLICIADVREEVVGNIELLLQHLLVFFCRTRYLYPAIGLPLLELAQSTLSIPIGLHCANPSYFASLVNSEQ